MPQSDEVRRKRKLCMHKLPGVNALTVQCRAMNITPEKARDVMRTVKHWVTDAALDGDNVLVVFYRGCTLERAKQTVFNYLGEYVT